VAIEPAEIEIARGIAVGGLAERPQVRDHGVQFIGGKASPKAGITSERPCVGTAVHHDRLPERGGLSGGAAVG
jgi:hypothetical protein